MPAINQSESWREALKIINRCPICSANYNVEKAQLFAKNETASLVHITCETCQSYFLAMIMVVGQGLSSVGMVTDLNLEDVKRLYKKPALVVDDVIFGYQLVGKQHFLQSLILNG